MAAARVGLVYPQGSECLSFIRPICLYAISIAHLLTKPKDRCRFQLSIYCSMVYPALNPPRSQLVINYVQLCTNAGFRSCTTVNQVMPTSAHQHISCERNTQPSHNPIHHQTVLLSAPLSQSQTQNRSHDCHTDPNRDAPLTHGWYTVAPGNCCAALIQIRRSSQTLLVPPSKGRHAPLLIVTRPASASITSCGRSTTARLGRLPLRARFLGLRTTRQTSICAHDRPWLQMVWNEGAGLSTAGTE